MVLAESHEPVQFGETVLEAWDLPSAVLKARPGNLFPSRISWRAALGSDRVVGVLGALALTGYRPDRPEIVRVPKFDRTTRPGADLSIEDQIVFGAVVDAIRERIHEGFVTFTGVGEQDASYTEFERFPLAVEGAEYVLEADASAFYQYVDHEILAYELVGLTGWAEGAEAVVGLLSGWMGMNRGLPQGPWPSYILADVYISAAARSLLRSGMQFSRYSDDFRIAAATWSEVREAQLRLEEAFHSIGLVVAPGKLKTPKIATYRESLDRANDPRLKSAASRIAALELAINEYGLEPATSADVTAIDAQNAAAVLTEQLEVLPITVLSTRLIRRALLKLGKAQSPAGISLLSRLLIRYPHLTTNIARYVRQLMGTDLEDRAVGAVFTWIEGPSRLPWQVGWLVHSLTFASTRQRAVAEFAESLVYRDDVPWFAKGQAVLALATHGSLPTPSEFFSVFERSPRATRTDLVAAVVLEQPRWRRQFLEGVATDPILGQVASADPAQVRGWL